MIEDYVEERLNTLANIQMHECCKKSVINELLDIKLLLNKRFEEEVEEVNNDLAESVL